MRRHTIVIALLAFAGGTSVGTQLRVLQDAPTDRAASFSAAELAAIEREMDAETRTTTRLLEGGSYNINIRRIRGAEAALMHPRTTDVYVVRDGSGTLVTGGRMVDEDGEPIDGTRAAAIEGGTEETIRAGDLVFIPAGVPHQFRETDGITWFNIRFDTVR